MTETTSLPDERGPVPLLKEVWGGKNKTQLDKHAAIQRRLSMSIGGIKK